MRNRRVVRYATGTRCVACSIELLEPRLVLSGSAPQMLPMLEAIAPDAPFSTPPATATTPLQMRHFYDIDGINVNGIAGDGAGQTIAIVDAFDDPGAASDLHAFDTFYGLPDPPSFQVVDQTGGRNLPQTDVSGALSWEVEESLDVQWTHVMAPAANIVLVEGNSPAITDLGQGVQTAASLPNVVAVSMSWGAPEDNVPNETSYDPLFVTPPGHPGVTFLAATGDHGAPGTYPAYSPNVVAVGGTTIAFATGTTDGAYGSETAWSGSGGGFSQVEAQPSYQSFVKLGNTRAIPDVSLDADPQTGVAIYDSFDFGTGRPWAQYGGTSLGTPMWAALIAIADQGRASVGLSSLDGPAQTLPALYAVPATDFHDITTGSNGNFIAWAGYDPVTGIGTPVASKLANDLSTVAPAAPQVPVNFSDGVTLRQSSDHLYVDWTAGSVNGPMTGRLLVDDSTGIIINADGHNDPIFLDYTNGNPLPGKLSLQGTFTLNNLSGTNPLAGRAIDINGGTLYLNYAGSPDPISAIRQALSNGYNSGSWTGTPTESTGVIISSNAESNPGYMIGYADSANGIVAGQPANTIELKYTLGGDLNLTGTVNFADLAALIANYGKSASWDGAAITYSPTVGFADFALIVANYGKQATNSAALTATAVNATGNPALAGPDSGPFAKSKSRGRR